MTATLQVGTILIEQRPAIGEALGLQSEPYSDNWESSRDSMARG